ncbi:MAG: class I SAM-dependent methyltransferase [Aureispira sp.]
MKTPLSYRKNIPIYCYKTATDYQKDPYERFDSMVVRQAALHLADDWWGGYSMQAVLDFATPHYPKAPQQIAEIGCGIGRWIATLAQNHPQATCWGIDYSYQMLRQAQEFWVQGKELVLDLSHKGFAPNLTLKEPPLSNLSLGLAKASQLPFADNSQDLLLNSFLLDRLQDPAQGLLEMQRVLRPNGTLIFITPLNFDQATHWEQFYPPIKLQTYLHQIGFEVVEWQEDLMIQEQLDGHGNVLTWKCLGVVAVKQGS